MTTGTKSLLFGVHQFLWHPYTVWRGWRALYGKWPGFWETVAIFVHDIGYWGCERMDDAKGEQHPHFGANLITRLYRWFGPSEYVESNGGYFWLYKLCLYHSRYLAAKYNENPPSKLCWADKMSPVFDPPWFYLLRARLSGELKEYRDNAPIDRSFQTDREWYEWLQKKCEQDARERRPASHRNYAFRPYPSDEVIPIHYHK
jgi:hypothetical protein